LRRSRSVACAHTTADLPVRGDRATTAGEPQQRTIRLSDRENTGVDLARTAWLVTVLACLIAVAILLTQGYLGYAGVTLAVALAAALNLF
jgi:hypothetical protein